MLHGLVTVNSPFVIVLLFESLQLHATLYAHLNFVCGPSSHQDAGFGFRQRRPNPTTSSDFTQDKLTPSIIVKHNGNFTCLVW